MPAEEPVSEDKTEETAEDAPVEKQASAGAVPAEEPAEEVKPVEEPAEAATGKEESNEEPADTVTKPIQTVEPAKLESKSTESESEIEEIPAAASVEEK